MGGYVTASRTGGDARGASLLEQVFAGMVFEEGKPRPPVPDAARQCFVVMTRSSNSRVASVRNEEERRLQEADGKLVYFWPANRSSDAARVVVYALPLERSAAFLRQ